MLKFVGDIAQSKAIKRLVNVLNGINQILKEEIKMKIN